MSIIDSLAVAGIDIKTLLKDVDADRLVQGYIDELELMFKHHGTTYNIVSIKIIQMPLKMIMKQTPMCLFRKQ